MNASSADSAGGYARVARDLAETHGVAPTLQAIVRNAVGMLGCQWSAVAVTEELRERPARLAAANDEALAATIAQIAGEARESPGIRAFQSGEVVRCNDLTTTEDFPQYASEMVRRTPVRAVLSVPLSASGAPLGVLSCYADRVGAFRDEDVDAAVVLSDLAVIAIEAARGEDRADNLEVALVRSRTIGAAMGILIERFELSAAEAFEWLRRLSQDSNRNLGELAAVLVDTGTVPGLTEQSGHPTSGSPVRPKEDPSSDDLRRVT